LAALALATEKPTESLLDKKPAGRFERLITPIMWRNILLCATYQIIVLFIILFAGESIFGDDMLKTKPLCKDVCEDIHQMYKEGTM
jgi:magnesium-transporting ATPase (P-type)